MESADFYEYYSAIVECPQCGKELELDAGSVRYIEGDEVTCTGCKKLFELGESI